LARGLNKVQNMLHVPVTIVDNFFEYPDEVVNFALSCEYTKSEDGRWPGKRSQPLHLINEKLFNFSVAKVLSLFYDKDFSSLTWNVGASFQIVDNTYTDGWVHRDEELLTVIIYLTKNADLKSGTSIYRAKKENITAITINTEYKNNSYLNGTDETLYRNQNNDQFEETINISNVYNRMICFDSHLLHAAQNFSNNSDPRLTLVMFIGNVSNMNTPIRRMKFIG